MLHDDRRLHRKGKRDRDTRAPARLTCQAALGHIKQADALFGTVSRKFHKHPAACPLCDGSSCQRKYCIAVAFSPGIRGRLPRNRDSGVGHIFKPEDGNAYLRDGTDYAYHDIFRYHFPMREHAGSAAMVFRHNSGKMVHHTCQENNDPGRRVRIGHKGTVHSRRNGRSAAFRQHLQFQDKASITRRSA